MCPRLRDVPWFAAETQSHLSWRWMPHTPFALCARPSGRGHDLAAPVHDVSCRVHDPPTLHLTLSLDAPRRGAQRPVGDAWRPQFGTVRGALSYFASGALPSGLCAGAAQSGDPADAVW